MTQPEQLDRNISRIWKNSTAPSTRGSNQHSQNTPPHKSRIHILLDTHGVYTKIISRVIKEISITIKDLMSYSDYNGNELEINARKTTGKFSNN